MLMAGAPTAGERARAEMEPVAEAEAEPAGLAGLPLPVGPKVEMSARTPGTYVSWMFGKAVITNAGECMRHVSC